MNNLQHLPKITPETASPFRYPAQVEILQRAVQGDVEAVELAMQYLSSNIQNLRFLMQSAMHDWHHTRLWQHLLYCLGMHRWQITPGQAFMQDCHRRDDPDASLRIDQSLTEVFLRDESSAEKSAKEVVLRLGLASPEVEVRQVSAYLLGLRGDPSCLPFLEKVIEYGDTQWKIHAISALVALDRAECAPILLHSLADSQREVHQAAGRALEDLGRKAQPALIQALEHPNSHVRWHAARLLGASGDPKAVKMLANGLTDADHTVRWASATSLAALGKPAAPAVLEVIRTHELTEPLRQVVYHALHAMPPACREKLHPLIEALSSPLSAGAAPAIASRLLLEVVC